MRSIRRNTGGDGGAKLSLIIFLAYFLTKKEDKIRSFSFAFLSTILLSGLVIGLVGKEPDFGAAFFLTVMVFLLLFVSGARVIYIAAACMAAFPVAYYLLTTVAYRHKRLLSFIRPWEDPTGTSFQIVQSFLSFGSGGLFGLGLGEGRQKLFFLPAPHTDFIFSIIGEELGLVGAMIVVLLFFIFTVRGLHIALSLGDRFGAYLALGITLMISLQTLDPTKIDWDYLSNNPNAIHLLEQNQDKFNWYWLSSNPSIFTYDYKKLKQRMKDTIAEDLMKNRFHPKNMDKWSGWKQLDDDDLELGVF